MRAHAGGMLLTAFVVACAILAAAADDPGYVVSGSTCISTTSG